MGRSLPAVVLGGGCDSQTTKDRTHHGQEEGIYDPRTQEEAPHSSPQEGRCGTKADIENASVDDLKKICQQYFDKWYKLGAEMFFLQREVILRDLQINELTISVSDMKGKFIKPSLKKVSKYENKFAKLQEKAAKFAFANQLKAK